MQSASLALYVPDVTQRSEIQRPDSEDGLFLRWPSDTYLSIALRTGPTEDNYPLDQDLSH